MNKQCPLPYWAFLLVLGMGLASCSGSGMLADENLTGNGFRISSAKISEVVNQMPNYQSELHALKGKGRAIVSEPGNTERLTIRFSSNRSKSLVKLRNGIGVEGGELLTDGDTLLVYNKVDKFARKIPIRGGELDHINQLASLNILEMINYSVSEEKVQAIRENEKLYQLKLAGGTEVYVDKETYSVRQVIQPEGSQLPYSKITYDAYATVEGFTLPRRISIFGAKGESKIYLQLTTLELNPQLDNLTINLPDNIPIYYR